MECKKCSAGVLVLIKTGAWIEIGAGNVVVGDLFQCGQCGQLELLNVRPRQRETLKANPDVATSGGVK